MDAVCAHSTNETRGFHTAFFFGRGSSLSDTADFHVMLPTKPAYESEGLEAWRRQSGKWEESKLARGLTLLSNRESWLWTFSRRSKPRVELTVKNMRNPTGESSCFLIIGRGSVARSSRWWVLLTIISQNVPSFRMVCLVCMAGIL